MALDIFKFFKGIRIKNATTPTKELELTVSDSATASTKTTIEASQTANRTITLPDATDTLVSRSSTDTLTNKTIDADGTGNSITNLDDGNIKALAGIDATKIADGSISNTEFQFLNNVSSNIQTQLNAKISATSTDTLSNKTLDNSNTITVKDANLTIQDDADATKQAKFQASGITAGQTRTLTIPDASTTLVGTDTSQTLSNKTLTTPVIAQITNTGTLTLPTATTTLVGRDTSDTLTNKSFDDSIALKEIATPATPGSGYGRIYFKSDGFLYQLNDDGTETKVGAGSGGINYISNPDFESTTTGWAAYADAAGTRPVDGTGGSPNVTITRTTSTPLRGTASGLITKDAANRQGQGISYDFTINQADRAKVLQISFDWTVASGTYSGGTSSTDSDMIVYIYDVTNSTLIEPTPIKLDGAVSGTNYSYRGVFQAASNSSSYRLILHCATTSASAYTVKFDNVVVGPQSINQGTIVTEWTSFTPTSTWVSNTTHAGKWRRVGDMMEVQVLLTLTGAPTSTTLSVNMPSGYTIDTTKLSSTSEDYSSIGTFMALDSGTGQFFGNVAYGSTTSVRPKFVKVASASNNDSISNISQADPMNWAINDNIYMQWRVPIVGWGAVSQLGQDADTRVVALEATGSSTVISGSDTTVTWTTTTKDSHGAFNGTTYTVPVSGWYTATAQIRIDHASIAAGQYAAVGIQKNGGAWAYQLVSAGSSSNTIIVPIASKTGYFNAGDTIRATASGTGTTPSISAQSFYTNFSVQRVSGPSQVAATEKVVVDYANGAGTTLSGSDAVNTLSFPTKLVDTHNAFSGTTFTAPKSDYYYVTVFYNIQSIGNNVRIITTLRKNGSNFRRFGLAPNNTGAAATLPNRSASTGIYLKAGETMTVISQYDEASSRSLEASQDVNWINIQSQGGV